MASKKLFKTEDKEKTKKEKSVKKEKKKKNTQIIKEKKTQQNIMKIQYHTNKYKQQSIPVKKTTVSTTKMHCNF